MNITIYIIILVAIISLIAGIYFLYRKLIKKYYYKKRRYEKLQNNYNGIIHYCEKYLKYDKTSIKVLTDYADAYRKKGNLDKAYEIADKIKFLLENMTPVESFRKYGINGIQYIKIIGDIHFSRQQYDLAIQYYKSISILEDYSYELNYNMHKIYYIKEEYYTAIEYILKTGKLNKRLFKQLEKSLINILEKLKKEYSFHLLQSIMQFYKSCGQLKYIANNEGKELYVQDFYKYMRTYALMELNKYNDAYKLFNTVSEKNIIIGYYYIKSMILFHLKKIPEAIKCLYKEKNSDILLNKKIIEDLKDALFIKSFIPDNTIKVIRAIVELFLNFGSIETAMKYIKTIDKIDVSDIDSKLSHIYNQKLIYEIEAILNHKTSEKGFDIIYNNKLYFLRPSKFYYKKAKLNLESIKVNLKYLFGVNAIKEGVKVKQGINYLQEIVNSDSKRYKDNAIGYLALYYKDNNKLSNAKQYFSMIDKSSPFLSINIRNVIDKYSNIEDYKDVIPDDVETQLVPKRKAVSLIDGNRYANYTEIGKGGMGKVFKAYDVILKRNVAIKKINPDFVNNDEVINRFIREAQAMASLKHKNITTIFDIGQMPNPYIIMEYVEGTSIRKIIRAKQKLPLNTIINFFIQTARALNFAHNNNIIHRDVKPDNILIEKGNTIKLVDFGLARLENATIVTSKGAVLGTKIYMSPEQIKGETIDERTDIYSYGITFFETLVLRLPFDKGDAVYKHLYEKPYRISNFDSNIPGYLDELINSCIQRERENRPPNFEQIINVLNENRND